MKDVEVVNNEALALFHSFRDKKKQKKTHTYLKQVLLTYKILKFGHWFKSPYFTLSADDCCSSHFIIMALPICSALQHVVKNICSSKRRRRADFEQHSGAVMWPVRHLHRKKKSDVISFFKDKQCSNKSAEAFWTSLILCLLSVLIQTRQNNLAYDHTSQRCWPMWRFALQVNK